MMEPTRIDERHVKMVTGDVAEDLRDSATKLDEVVSTLVYVAKPADVGEDDGAEQLLAALRTLSSYARIMEADAQALEQLTETAALHAHWDEREGRAQAS